MSRRRRANFVRISHHARERWRQYGGRGKLSGRVIQRRLMGALRGGLECIGPGVQVEIEPGLLAVCVPELTGGWKVVTIVCRDPERIGGGSHDARRVATSD